MNGGDHSEGVPPAAEARRPGEEELKRIRDRLTRERTRLASRRDREEAELKGHRDAVGERAPCAFLSPAAASEDVAQGVRATMHSQTQHDLEMVDQALARLNQDAASFGLCHHCGEPISPARLDILPQTTTCERCLERGSS